MKIHVDQTCQLFVTCVCLDNLLKTCLCEYADASFARNLHMIWLDNLKFAGYRVLIYTDRFSLARKHLANAFFCVEKSQPLDIYLELY